MAKKGAKKKQEKAKKRGNKDDTDDEPQPHAVVSDDLVVPADGNRVHCGLNNLGNTCFFNSVLQCLNVSLPFSDDMLSMNIKGDFTTPLCEVFRGIRGIVTQSQGKKKQVGGGFNPKSLHTTLCSKYPWYKGKTQQDAHELLRTLLGGMSDERGGANGEGHNSDARLEVTDVPEANRHSRFRDSLKPTGATEQCIWDNFKGHHCATSLCWSCHRLSTKIDPFLDLMLELPNPSRPPAGPLGVPQPGGRKGDLPPPPSGGEPSSSSKAATASSTSSKPSISAAQNDVTSILQIAQATILASLRNAFEAIGEPIEAFAPMKREPIIINLDLQRTSKKAVAKWGFRWDGSAASDFRLVLSGITEDTPVDKYNLKCRTKLEDEKILLEGDELIGCNGEEDFTEMQRVMDDSKKISLRFRRMPQTEAAIKADKPKRSKKQKYVDLDEAEAEEARSLRRSEFEAEGAQVFAQLPMPLQEAFGPEASCKIDNADIALDSCVRMFSRVEAIEDDFMRRTICDECQRLAKAKANEDNKGEALPSKTFSSRKLWLWPAGLPNLLTVQLKRFRNYGGKMEKSSARVKLPPVLDLSQHMLTKDVVTRLRPHLAEDARLPEVAETSSGCLFELYGICEHIGSMGGGHYVAYVNAGPSLAEENWYYISDASRDKSTLEKVLNAQAYIAFYRRV